MADKDHGILPDASVEGPPFDTLTLCIGRMPTSFALSTQPVCEYLPADGSLIFD